MIEHTRMLKIVNINFFFIDILLFNNERHNYQFLKLPHPEMQNRRFALLPLTEIAPDILHPVLNKTITELLNECTDELQVSRVDRL